jgi:cellulose synthase/poly-beta-1,6-N-acetylglucosamine synthase-like glycosyltransferase
MQELAYQPNLVRFVLSKKFDIAMIMLSAAIAFYYLYYISLVAFPVWDSAIYLENAQNWLTNQPLEASYRPPLMSWIIAGIWSVSGEDWTIAKYIQPLFTISAGIVFYLTLKKYKGDFFAFGVAALTMLNGYVFYWSTQILTESLSLFFLILSVYFLKSKTRSAWIFAGIAIGLTFGARYPIFVLAIAIFVIEIVVGRDARKILMTLLGIVPVLLLIIMAVYLKSGSFTVAIERDTELSLILSSFYLQKFIAIFGVISVLLPISFLFRRTYTDKYNYTFIGWFLAGFLFWSAIAENQQERFMIQIMPAVYFLTALAIQSIWKGNSLLSACNVRDFLRDLKTTAYNLPNWGYVILKRGYTITLKWLSYYPVRYYLCAFLISYFSLSYLQAFTAVEEEILHGIFKLLNMTSFFVYGELHVNFLGSDIPVVVPVYAQLIFLIFFPTMAITSRINIKKRIQFISFGLLCFSCFVAIQLLTILIPVAGSSPIRLLVNILLTIVIGGLIIELSLWSTILIPSPTKIKRILKRSYMKEYALFISVAVASMLITVYTFLLLRIVFDSPLMIYALVTLSSVPSVVYLLGNFIYEINRQNKKSGSKLKAQGSRYYPKISFLIPAYNEEAIIGQCIHSIDRAAANYTGRTEIIIVNDGSKDNTEKLVLVALDKLKYACGKIFTISNSGKGFALDYGLKRTSGEIIFRMDADSIIDKDAIGPLIEHFKDPSVGSVSGFVFPMKGRSIFGRAQNILFASYLYVKRAQELFDSIIVQPGPSTAFRKTALIKIGGWTHNQFGEDGEISSRIARFGYRCKFEQRCIVYSDLPGTLGGFVAQRSRWSIAFYHSRGRNLEQVKDISSPRAFVFLHNLESHGAGFGLNFAWVVLAAALVTGNTNFFLSDLTPSQIFLATIFIKLTAIHILISGAQVLLYSYTLKKMNRLDDIKYYLVMRFLNVVVSMWVKVVATETLLRWSSKWSKYGDDAFRDLRNYMHSNIDPGTPAATTKQNTSLLIDIPILNMAGAKNRTQ